MVMSLSLPPPAKASQTYLATSPTAEGEEDGSHEGGGESDGEPPPPPPPPAALVMTVAAAPGLTGGSPQVTGRHSGGRSKSQLEEVQEVRHLRFNCRRGKKNASPEKSWGGGGRNRLLPIAKQRFGPLSQLRTYVSYAECNAMCGWPIAVHSVNVYVCHMFLFKMPMHNNKPDTVFVRLVLSL